ncbi:hypothetical protein ACFPQ7_13165, partial [Methylobacterium iners]
MNKIHDVPLPEAAPAQRHPTRRHLLALLAGVHVLSAKPSRAEAGATEATPDALPELFETFQRLLVQREAALRRCDQLVASLRAGRELPRVRLPMPA